MGVNYNERNKSFHLQTKHTSYLIHVFEERFPAHVYWGKKLKDTGVVASLRHERRNYSPKMNVGSRDIFLEVLPQEYPSYGISDFREPAFQVQHGDGSTISDLIYKTYRIYKGKKKLEGLPSIYAESDDEVETLEIELADEVSGLKVILSYSVFEDQDAITRNAYFVNEGKNELKLLRALSASVDFDCCDFDFMSLNGTWAKERHIVKRP